MAMRPSPPARAGLFEEAFGALRHAPAPVGSAYLIGTVPFLLGFLYFCADMSWHAQAPRRMVGAALGLAALFVWMKVWHTVFAARLRQHVLGERPPRWTPLEALQMIGVQAVFQAVGVLLVPVSAILVLPLPWTYAFFQAATVLGDGRDPSLSSLASRAGRACFRWPLQNLRFHASAGLMVAVTLANITAALILLPLLAKALLGLDSPVTRNPMVVANSTFLLTVLALTYLAADPVFRTFHVLRCIQFEALRTGDDLRARLRRRPGLAPAAALLLAAVVAPAFGSDPVPARSGDGVPGGGMVSATTSGAADPPTRDAADPRSRPAETRDRGPAGWTVRPDALEASLRSVLDHPRYAWRMPREEEALLKDTAFAQWLEGVMLRVQDGVRRARLWLESLSRRIRQWFAPPPLPPDAEGPDRWEIMLRYGALLALVASTGMLIWAVVAGVRHRRRLRARTPAPFAPVDHRELADESITADRLPSDQWVDLAERMRAEGRLRLAMRALYLAMLAWLSEQKLLHIRPGKTNRQFVDELSRRRHALPVSCRALAAATVRFEAVWYGPHPATDAGFGELTRRLAEVRSHG